jgi:hypothetical protein
MDINEAVRLLDSLLPEDKMRSFTRLCHNLTVVARDTYDSAGGVTDAGRLRALNEIEHRMTGFLLALVAGDDGSDLDQAVARMFFSERADAHLARLLASAFELSLMQFGQKLPQEVQTAR